MRSRKRTVDETISGSLPEVCYYVRAIQLTNFKSYRGSHTLGPFEPFTCVIGPNGSGKSNITDAIGFCFGLAPEYLRAREYQDLIAAGCTHMEVTVIFGPAFNVQEQISHDSELCCSLTRKINVNSPDMSRRNAAMVEVTTELNSQRIEADALEQFLEKGGISVRLRNFVAMQHEVESMAQKGPKELTELLEVVSGSLALRDRYHAAQGAYEEAHRRLLSISNEKREIHAEVNRYRLHKKDADRFTELTQKVVHERQELILLKLLYLETQVVARRTAKIAAVKEFDKLDSASKQGNHAKDLRKQYSTLHAKHMSLLKNARDATNVHREKNANVERLRVHVQYLEGRLNREVKELSDSEGAEQSTNVEIQKLQELIREREKALEVYDRKCNQEDQEHGAFTLTSVQRDEYKKLRKEADTESYAVRQQMEIARRERDAHKEAIRRSQLIMEDMVSRQKESSDALELAQSRQQHLATRIKTLDNEIEAGHAECERLSSEVASVMVTRSERLTEYEQVQAQMDRLQHHKEETRHEQVLKESLQAMQVVTSGVRGRLIDLCSIPNSKYTVAVTVALGRNIDAVLVDTQAAALECVRYLKENRIGVMHFIPLDTAQGKRVDDRHRSFGNTCRPVVDVVKFDAAIEPAIRFALGQTLVCDTLEEARRVAFGQPDGSRYRVVTVDGSLLLKNGAVQGGLQTVQERARAWDQKTYHTLKQTRDRLHHTLYVEDPENTMTGVMIENKEAQQKLCALRQERERAVTEHAQLEKRMHALSAEQRSLRTTLQHGKDRLTVAENSYASCEAERVRLSEQVRTIECKVFHDFSKNVGIADIFEWSQREGTKSAERAEKRQSLLLQISRLRSQKELEEQRARGIGHTSTRALGAMSEKTREDLARACTELKAQEQAASVAEKQHVHAARELEKIKEQMYNIETRLRESARTTSEDSDKMVAARKLVATASMALEKLRHERKSIYLRCALEGVTVPVLTGEEVHTVGLRGANTRRSGTRQRTGGADAAHSVVQHHEDEDEDEEGGDGAPEGVGDGSPQSSARDIPMSETFLVEDTGSLILSQGMQDSNMNSSSGGGGTSGNKRTRGAQSAHRTSNPAEGNSKTLTVAFDFRGLPDRLRRCAQHSKRYQEVCRELEGSIQQIEENLERLAPTVQAVHRHTSSEHKLEQIERQLETSREALRVAHIVYRTVLEERTARFNKCFNTVNDTVGKIYRELTENTRAPGVHGTAYLTLDDSEEPFNGGTRYHATPPMKRFMGVEALSGGEKTMAALALLFALRTVQPSPFVILDEVDAALDAANVLRLSEYLRNHCMSCQFIVVSLKDELYRNADALVGVYKDRTCDSSGVVGLHLSAFPL